MKLEKFGGMLPAWDVNLIPEGQASTASNAYLFSGALEGWREPTLLRLMNSGSKFSYRIPLTGKSIATAFLNFIAQPHAGDTVQVGEFIYTWVNGLPGGGAAFQVLIAGSATLSATNLLNAITADNGLFTNAGVQYGGGTPANPFIAGFNNQLGAVNGVLPVTPVGLCLQIISTDYGANFNTVAIAESTGGVRTLWLANTAARTNTTTTLVGGANASQSVSVFAPSQFLDFADPDTNVVKSQVALDQYERYYFASPSQAPTYNTRSRINAGKPAWLLGIPPPAVAPTVDVIGGGDTGTLGPTVGNGSQVLVGANTVYLLPVVPNGTFFLNDVSFIPNATNPNVNWVVVVYQDAGTSNVPTYPGALCNVSPINTGVTANTTSVGTFTNPCATIPDTVYWIGILMDTSTSIETGDNTGSSATFSTPFSNNPPATAPAITTGAQDLAMWADLSSSAVQESRAYVYTYISAYGEEGPPSPFTLVNGWANGTWNIGLTPPPPLDMGTYRNIAIMRIYRTIAGTTGLTTYFQVADISVNSTDPDAVVFVAQDQALAPTLLYQDNLDDSVVTQNVQLPSTNWFPPPSNLQGFLNLPNGGIAAFRNQEVWFCEPYLPHAWPLGYMQTVDFPIVGIGLTAGAVIVATSSVPFVCQFVSPAQITVFKCSAPAPCTSRGSIVSLEIGVIYMSPNGLVQINNAGALSNLSETWIKREDWQQLTPQKNTRAIYLAGMYYCWGTTNGSDTSVAQQGFTLELNTDVSSFGVWPQPGGHRIGFMPLTSVIGNIDNVFTDPWSGQAILVAGGNEYVIDFTNTNPIIQPYDFKTKKYREVSKKNYSALRVFFTPYSTSPPTRNPQPNTAAAFDASWNTLQPQQLAIVKVWADVDDGFTDGSMQLVMARELTRNGQIMRIPDGFKAESWQFEVMSRVKITNIQVATSVDELGEV